MNKETLEKIIDKARDSDIVGVWRILDEAKNECIGLEDAQSIYRAMRGGMPLTNAKFLFGIIFAHCISDDDFQKTAKQVGRDSDISEIRKGVMLHDNIRRLYDELKNRG